LPARTHISRESERYINLNPARPPRCLDVDVYADVTAANQSSMKQPEKVRR